MRPASRPRSYRWLKRSRSESRAPGKPERSGQDVENWRTTASLASDGQRTRVQNCRQLYLFQEVCSFVGCSKWHQSQNGVAPRRCPACDVFRSQCSARDRRSNCFQRRGWPPLREVCLAGHQNQQQVEESQCALQVERHIRGGKMADHLQDGVYGPDGANCQLSDGKNGLIAPSGTDFPVQTSVCLVAHNVRSQCAELAPE